MNDRKIQALRNLAERPGTPAEGEVARRKLEEALKPKPVCCVGTNGRANQQSARAAYEFSFGWPGYAEGVDFTAVAERLFAGFAKSFANSAATEFAEQARAAVAHCWCGTDHACWEKCPNMVNHMKIMETLNQELRSKFPRGTRVYYNARDCPANSSATMSGYSGAEIFWVRLKFDHLEGQVVAVPSRHGKHWRISLEPLTEDEIESMGLRS